MKLDFPKEKGVFLLKENSVSLANNNVMACKPLNDYIIPVSVLKWIFIVLGKMRVKI